MRTDPHGTLGRYWAGCRCRRCRDAINDYTNQRRVDRAVRLQLDPTLAEHGTASTYNNWMCRCRECTDAKVAQRNRKVAREAA